MTEEEAERIRTSPAPSIGTLPDTTTDKYVCKACAERTGEKTTCKYPYTQIPRTHRRIGHLPPTVMDRARHRGVSRPHRCAYVRTHHSSHPSHRYASASASGKQKSVRVCKQWNVCGCGHSCRLFSLRNALLEPLSARLLRLDAVRTHNRWTSRTRGGRKRSVRGT